jgi:hypothetical protein
MQLVVAVYSCRTCSHALSLAYAASLGKQDADGLYCCCSMPAVCESVHDIHAECRQRLLQVALRVTCVSSFPDVPHLQLSYSIQGQQVAHNLMLPIVVSKFCTPPDNPVPKDVFFSRWRAIAGKSHCQTQGA